MFEEKRILFLYVETPLHVGIGRGTGSVDLPIQRERTTGYPMIQSSGVKGCLRSVYREANRLDDEDPKITDLFGKAGSAGDNFAGAIAPGDARLLLFPVRSLAGVFAWTTSRHALAMFKRSLEFTDQSIKWELPDKPESNNLWIGKDSTLKSGGAVVLEEFSFEPKENSLVDEIAQWIGENAFAKNLIYWKDTLASRLCILPEDAFRDFCLYATEVQTHIRIDPEKKTVLTGALWTSESLPVDSLLYAPLLATGVRSGSTQKTASQVLGEVTKLDLQHIQIGGDETTGQGWTAARLFPEVSNE